MPLLVFARNTKGEPQVDPMVPFEIKDEEAMKYNDEMDVHSHVS